MTPWHHDDLAHRILNSSQAKNWVVLKLPAEPNEHDPLKRKPFETLAPDRQPWSELMSIKETLGRDYNALYLLEPSADEGNIFNPTDFIEYEQLPTTSYTAQSWDTAFKEKQENDFSCMIEAKVAKDGYYLTGYKKGKWAIDGLKFEVQDAAKLNCPNALLIEDAASGQSIIQSIKTSSEHPIIGISPRKYGKDKVERAHNANDGLRAGLWHIPKYAPWKTEFLESLKQFPNGLHDDDVDAFTQLANFLTKRFANALAVYQNFSDSLHTMTLDDIAHEKYISIYVAFFIDTMACAVCCGITQYGHIVVLDEFVSTSGISDLMSEISGYTKMMWSTFDIQYVVHTERTDSYWQSVFADYTIEYGLIGRLDFEECCDLVKERLDTLIRKRTAISVIADNCPKLLEGFRGAYSYKSRDDSSTIDYTLAPILNVYSRLHSALHTAVYQYEYEFGRSSRK
jgi:predicted phage terminase large subunit-like protein